MDIDAMLSFVSFVEARHESWRARQEGRPYPWTDDPIVRTHKFTNVFRVLDYGSQYLLTELLEPELSERDTLMRCFLYRHTGRPEVWDHLLGSAGYPVTAADLDETLDVWTAYRGGMTGRKLRRVGSGSDHLRVERHFTKPVFTGAYLVFPQTQEIGSDKLESILRLTQRLFNPRSPDDVVPDFLAARTQAERFAVLRRSKGVADFMSMQILTDWGYSQYGADVEDEFVVLGPGARKGAMLLGYGRPTDSLHWAIEAVRSSPGCPRIAVEPGRWRVPSHMDIQNCLCEFSKYARFVQKPGPGTPYRPAHPGAQPEPVYPQHW